MLVRYEPHRSCNIWTTPYDYTELLKASVSSQKARVNVVIAREPKRPRQSPNQIAASPPAPRNDIGYNKMYSMHGVIKSLFLKSVCICVHLWLKN